MVCILVRSKRINKVVKFSFSRFELKKLVDFFSCQTKVQVRIKTNQHSNSPLANENLTALVFWTTPVHLIFLFNFLRCGNLNSLQKKQNMRIFSNSLEKDTYLFVCDIINFI